MPLDFPPPAAPPTVGQIYLNWTWDGTKWVSTSGAAGNSVPEAPTDGQTYGRRSAGWTPALPLSGGILSGPLTLSANATSAMQAVPLQQLQQTETNLLPLSGGTLTGPLTLAGNATSNLQPATLQQLSVVNVLDHGAIGDGVTNDTVAIQNTLNAYAGKAIVLIPNTGSAFMVNSLFPPSNTALIINGTLMQSANNPAAVSGHTAGVLAFEHANNISVSGVGTVDGNGANQTNTMAAVSTFYCNNVRITGITIQNAQAWNLNVVQSSVITVDGVYLLGGHNSNEFASNCHECWITNSYINGPSTDGAFAFYGGVTNSGAIGNTVTNGGSGISIVADPAQNALCYGITISNNIICNSLGNGITIVSPAVAAIHNKITISNNVLFGNNNTPIGVSPYGIADIWLSSCQYVVVSGNKLHGNGNATDTCSGIYVGGLGGYQASWAVNITGNDISDVGQSRSDGIGILLGPHQGTDICISGNHIYDDQTSKTMVNAIAGPCAARAAITGNVFSAFISSALNITPASDTVVVNTSPGLFAVTGGTFAAAAPIDLTNKSGAARWFLGNDGSTESGSNTGSNLEIVSVTDANTLALVASFNRANGQFSLNYPPLIFSSSANAPPSFTTRSLGTKVVLWPQLSSTSVDYAVGVDASTMWHAVPTTAQQFKWYGGTTQIAALSGTGALTLSGPLTLPADPTTALQAATKQYVDAHAGTGGGGDTGTVTSITTGAGLTGGTITTSGTISAAFGTTAGTVVQGNDARFATIPTASATTPSMDGTASIGSLSSSYALPDHVHPTDTTRAPVASPAFTGTPTAPTVTPGTDNSTKVATTAFVQSAVAAVSAGVTTITTTAGLTGGGSGAVTLGVNFGTAAGSVTQGNDARFATIPVASSTAPVMNGVANIGTLTTYARADHVHPSDTSRGTVQSITAGAGLSGGTITTSGTIAVNYGTVAATAAQGNDARFGTIPTASVTTPSMDGTAAVGTLTTSFALADHVHASDTTRLAVGAAAIGDLSGTYPGPTVAKLQGTPISATAPTNNQVLQYSTASASWLPALAGTMTSITAGTGLSGGTITTTGTLALATIAANTLLANATGAAAAPTGTGIGAVIDAAIGNTQGQILYRSATVWTALPVGSSGQFLRTGGAAANPSWAAVPAGTVTQIVAGSGLNGGTITTSGTISANFGTVAGSICQGNDARFATYLPLAGGTLTGPLTLAADPTVSLQAATKHYVDGLIVSLAQSTAVGNGTTDDTTAVNNFLSPLPAGTTCIVPPGKMYLIGNADLVVPVGVMLRGVGNTSGAASATNIAKSSGFYLNPLRTIILNPGASITGCAILRAGLVLAPPNPAAAVSAYATWAGDVVELAPTAATAVNGTVLTFASTTGVTAGMRVFGSQIQASTTVQSVTSTTVTLSLGVFGNGIVAGQLVWFGTSAGIIMLGNGPGGPGGGGSLIENNLIIGFYHGVLASCGNFKADHNWIDCQRGFTLVDAGDTCYLNYNRVEPWYVLSTSGPTLAQFARSGTAYYCGDNSTGYNLHGNQSYCWRTGVVFNNTGDATCTNSILEDQSGQAGGIGVLFQNKSLVIYTAGCVVGFTTTAFDAQNPSGGGFPNPVIVAPNIVLATGGYGLRMGANTEGLLTGAMFTGAGQQFQAQANVSGPWRIYNCHFPQGGGSTFGTFDPSNGPNNVLFAGSVFNANFQVGIPPDGTVAGGNLRGAGSFDMQQIRTAATQVASGTYATCLGQNNTASGTASLTVGNGNVASQPNAVALGVSNTASAQNSVALNNGNTASGNNSFVSGLANFATGSQAAVLGGYQNTAAGAGSVVVGYKAQDYGYPCTFVQGTANGGLGQGTSQTTRAVGYAQTTSATPVRMTQDGNAAGATNAFNLPPNTCRRLRITVVGRQSGSNIGICWVADNVLAAMAPAVSTALVSAVTFTQGGTIGSPTFTTAPTCVADTINGALNISVTGVAAQTISWSVAVETLDVLA